jgi:hypothetical protein
MVCGPHRMDGVTGTAYGIMGGMWQGEATNPVVDMPVAGARICRLRK